jgi:hypothetical protein
MVSTLQQKAQRGGAVILRTGVSANMQQACPLMEQLSVFPYFTSLPETLSHSLSHSLPDTNR